MSKMIQITNKLTGEFYIVSKWECIFVGSIFLVAGICLIYLGIRILGAGIRLG